MDNIEKVFNMLDMQKIEYEMVSHEAIFTIEEMLALKLPKAELIAKNLFVRDDKKHNYYLFVIRGDKRVNLREIRQKIGSRPLCFASENDLYKYLGLRKGSVTPFGVINDQMHETVVYIDADFKNSLIGVHPNENTSTVWLKTKDLFDFIAGQGNHVEFMDIP